MEGSVSHEWAEETPEAKARWFQSLTFEERAQLLCEFTELAFALNPRIADTKDAEQTRKGVRILELPRG
jgi:hypothetical protein